MSLTILTSVAVSDFSPCIVPEIGHLSGVLQGSIESFNVSGKVRRDGKSGKVQGRKVRPDRHDTNLAGYLTGPIRQTPADKQSRKTLHNRRMTGRYEGTAKLQQRRPITVNGVGRRDTVIENSGPGFLLTILPG
jgi:hypothetical protein